MHVIERSVFRTKNERHLASNGAPGATGSRVRVDGKFLVRGGRRMHIQGVTYGPFCRNEDGDPFPAENRVQDDFARMHAAGINSVRTYHVPPEWFLALADEQNLAVFIDVPWPKHLCFLDSGIAQAQAREFVRRAGQAGRQHSCVLAYSIGNEIPPSVVRWHGGRRVQRFLAELCDVVKQADPDGLATYANYPSTEYLDLPFLDFATFNVYLHDREAFRRYLFRLQNLVGDRPLLLGELGMDTLRHGELEQAEFLAGHFREAMLMGLAGAFVFAWTDDWHTGGHQIENWAFGITRADRSPKASYHALREVFDTSPAQLLSETPRVSVVVCTYNGARTLVECLRSLERLTYPNYEIIVVDDGSTDETQTLLSGFPNVRTITQPNQGLSAARNVGLHAASGSIVAYTDSDCFANPDWLTHLVHQLERSGAAAVGGPNLTPEDGWLAACVGAAPGQPMHVLESDQVSEHIPGCNMAFRREVLLAIGGFDPQFRKAGDDVDVCWRVQGSGQWITFAPGAFVWHHRRQGPRAYLRQQAGYGQAEALLRFKHPEKFNGRGDGKWRGVIYGASLQGLRLGKASVHRGIFAAGLFQCLYQPEAAHWAMLPGTLEWHAVAAVIGLSAVFWPAAWIGVAVLLALSFLVAGLQACQARLLPQYAGITSRLVVMGLCYAQPLVRSWHRYRTRIFGYRAPAAPVGSLRMSVPIFGSRMLAYWSELGLDRTELLRRLVSRLDEHRWSRALDAGWSDWDVGIHCAPGTMVQICTVEEDHGGGKRLLRVRYRLHQSANASAIAVVSLATAFITGIFQAWAVLLISVIPFAACLAIRFRAARRAAEVVNLVDQLAEEEMQLVGCERSPHRTDDVGQIRQALGDIDAGKVALQAGQ